MADLTNVKLEVNIDFTAHVGGDKTAELKHYQATVVFSSVDALLERGGESVKRLLQTQARSEDGFPTGRRVTVNEKGKFEPTKEERDAAAVAAVMAMDDEDQLEAVWKALQAKKAAKAAAEKAAQSKK